MRLDSQHISGRELASLDWLLVHHEAKSSFRNDVVERLGFRLGATIVDVGCGPGLWAPLFADALGATGTIFGYDVSKELIEYACQHNSALIANGRAQFSLGDITSPPATVSLADDVLIMNAIGYLKDPAQSVSGIWQHMKTGARLVIRQFDNGATVFSCVDTALQMRIYADAARSRHIGNSGDAFLGRHLVAIARQAGIGQFNASADVVFLQAPLSVATRRYLGWKAEWFAARASEFSPTSDLAKWKQALPYDGNGGAFDTPEFGFSTLEYQIEAIKDV